MKKKERHKKRKKRVRSRMFGTKKRPRLSVFRSSRYLYAQLIDDTEGHTLLGLSDRNLSGKVKTRMKRKEQAFLLGEEIAKRAKRKRISSIIFDRSGYKYHGRVRAFAEGARKGGLKF